MSVFFLFYFFSKHRQNIKVEATNQLNDETVAGTSSRHLAPNLHQFDDSLSSLSVESEDDGNVLSQVIAAGVNKVHKPIESSSNPINIPIKPRPSGELCNDSVSSVDSTGRDDATSLLEQCIQSGINKNVKKDSSVKRQLVTSSPKKSMLPKPGSSAVNKTPKKSLDKKDEELLEECIKTGILSATKNEVDHLQATITNLSISGPKNGESTSVIAQDSHQLQCVSTITGVEANTNVNSRMKMDKIDHEEDSIASRNEHSHQANWTTQNGFDMSFGSIDDNILERSNEYPAGKLSIMTSGFDLDDCSESLMEISNEFMVENEKLVEAKIEDKHRDPDLMLKSVDRLTQELVQTAEYLRKNTNDETSKMSGSNTWNDEVSFPSISMSAPMIGSTNDEATFASDQNNPIPSDDKSQQQQPILDDKTPTNENYAFPTDEHDSPLPKVEFKVGGEIGTQNSSGPKSFITFGPASIETNSTMSNSTIVQAEAKKIVNRINSMSNKLVDSTTSLMDLEKVRPPSSMDCYSLTIDSVQQSPMRKQRTSMTGIIAKRALGHQIPCGSIESVNSILNLDSIRPPSLMDELLDSMISVDSIVSEVVDPTLGISNYQTAMSDMDDSLTLMSCHDLSKDETLQNGSNGTSDEFSSVESTPKKRSKSLRNSTRQTDKDRYKTYTIQHDNERSQSPDSPRRSMNARQRRQEDRHRFESQSIEASPTHVNRRKENPDRFKTYNIEQSYDDDQSIRAMTENFEFLRNSTSPNVATGIDTNEIRIKLNKIRSTRQQDDSLEYERQNSETESQRDARNSSLNDGNSSVEQEDSEASTPTPTEQPKVVKPKSTYVSPYRMTATKVTPAKPKPATKVVVKTPVITKAAVKSEVKTPPASSVRNGVKPRLNLAIKTSTPTTVKSGIPKPTTTPVLEVPPTPPIRQGTFIQDEPTLENVPIVNDLSPTTKSTPSKLKPPTSRVVTKQSTSTPPKKNSIVAALPQFKFRSNSNASMKTSSTTMSPPVVVKPIRSNTGITLNNQRKNVTSKIAGLWKNTNGNEKISTAKKSVNSPANVGVLRRTISAGGNKVEKIKRSSTCEEIGK
jgi:hypothetical protein